MKVITVILGAIGLVIMFLITVFVFAILLAIPVWLLWNWVGVDVLALKHKQVLVLSFPALSASLP